MYLGCRSTERGVENHRNSDDSNKHVIWGKNLLIRSSTTAWNVADTLAPQRAHLSGCVREGGEVVHVTTIQWVQHQLGRIAGKTTIHKCQRKYNSGRLENVLPNFAPYIVFLTVRKSRFLEGVEDMNINLGRRADVAVDGKLRLG